MLARRQWGVVSGARTWLGRYDVLALAAGIWFLGKFLRYAFPPLFDELQGTFQVSNAALGAAFTGFMVVYALAQFPSGLLADRFGSARVIAGGVLTATAGAGVVVLGGPFGLLVVAMLVMGAGTGAHKTVAIKLISLVYPARTGRTLGIFDTFGTFGGVVAPLGVAGVAAFAVDWRVVFVFAALLGVALGSAVAVRVPGHVSDGGRTGNGGGNTVNVPFRAYARPFRTPRFVAFVALTFAFSFAYNGLVAFLPLFLVQEVGTSTAAASVLYSVLFVVSVVQVLTGELADRIGRLTVVSVTVGLATVSLALLLVSSGSGVELLGVPLVAALAVVGFGVGGHGFRPARDAHLTGLLPDSLAGGGIGAVRSGLMAVGAVSPALVGLTADLAGFVVAFSLLLVSLSGAVALAVGLRLTR